MSSLVKVEFGHSELVRGSRGRDMAVWGAESFLPFLPQPKIVEALLGYEITQVACGASHILAVSNEGEVFAWGRGDNGE